MALEANTSQFQYKYIEKITESACGAENPQGINGYVFIYVMCMYYVYIYIYIYLYIYIYKSRRDI